MRMAELNIVAVWQALGGGPLRGNRGQGFYRNGDGHNVALDPAKNAWYDYRDGRGGGVLALVETALGCDRRTALRWLECQGFIESRTLTHEQRREHAMRKSTASALTLDIECWRSALIVELNARKLVAAKADNDEALACAASLCNVLEDGSPKDIVCEFSRHRARNPEDVARLIAAGQNADQQARRITAQVVLLLTRSVEREGLSDAA